MCTILTSGAGFLYYSQARNRAYKAQEFLHRESPRANDYSTRNK